MSWITTSQFRVTHVRFSQKDFMKFLSFQKNVIIFHCKASREKMSTALTLKRTLTYSKLGLFISEESMCVSHKSLSWNIYPFKRTRLSFKVKLLERIEHCSNFEQYLDIFQTMDSLFRVDMCVFHKSISWNSYPFKRTWLSFNVMLEHRKWTLR